MRSAIAPLSSSRRQTGSEPLALTSFRRAGADQLSDNLSGGVALNIRRQFNAEIFAL